MKTRRTDLLVAAVATALRGIGGQIFLRQPRVRNMRGEAGGPSRSNAMHIENGKIQPDKVLGALERGGAEKVILFLEISHRERYPAENRVLEDLDESVNFWREYVKD